MNKLNKLFSIILMCLLCSSSIGISEELSYKCLVQMKNYDGEGAYLIISLIDPDGKYDRTLYVQGDDPDWYHEISSWWKFYGRKRTDIDGITGETLSGGERSINLISFNKSKLIKGYKLRFETAVEDKNYFEKDLEIDLVELNTKSKYNGIGFIRYVRIIDN
jgi:hypothetical protein